MPYGLVWSQIKLEFTQNDKYIIMIIDKFYIALFSGLHRLTAFYKAFTKVLTNGAWFGLVSD